MPTRNRNATPTPPPRLTSTTEFARYVGLARTTVSRVLNGHPGIKPRTIERVQRAMAETGFTPNAFAAHLTGKRTGMVGICVETLLTPPVVQKLAALQHRLRQHDHTCLIEVLEPGGLLKVLRHFQSMRVGAIVFIGYFDTAELSMRISELEEQSLPHLVIDHEGITGAHTVTLDRIAAMRELTDHLISLGHRSFGLLGLSLAIRSAQDRVKGISDALAAHHLAIAATTHSLDHLHTADAPSDYELGRRLALSFLQMQKPPTAFIARNDEIALGAIHGLQSAGRSVPEEFSVTGFNNQDISRMCRPALTTIDQQVEETIKIATELLLNQMQGGAQRPPILRTIRPRIEYRASTSAPPAASD